MNTYVYAPKDDPFHRERWREAYPEETLAQFTELVSAGRSLSVRVGFAVAPGVSIVYSDATHQRDLEEKLRQLRGTGSDFLCLALDDVPTTLQHRADRDHYPSLAAAHVDIAHRVKEWIGDEATLWLVPTDYVGSSATDYLTELGERLSTEIEIGWTGRTVLSPDIPLAEANARRETLRRKPLVWDNVPVADGPMRAALHLGPYLGRDPELSDAVSGLLLNPMIQARASALTVGSAAAYMSDPEAYDAEASWTRSAEALGSGAPEAFATFASAHRFGPMSPKDRDPELEALWNRLRGDDPIEKNALGAFAAAVSKRKGAADGLAGLADRTLFDEIEAWVTAHHRESGRLETCVALLETIASDPGPMVLLRELFRFEANLRESPPVEISYGPRRLVYPQLASLRDDSAVFGNDPVLFRNRSLVDAIVDWVEDLTLAKLHTKEK
jgi:hyaluronoglucosaminidase